MTKSTKAIELGARLAAGERPWVRPLSLAGLIGSAWFVGHAILLGWASDGIEVHRGRTWAAVLDGVDVIGSIGGAIGVATALVATVVMLVRARRARQAWRLLTPAEQRYAARLRDPEFRALMDRLMLAGQRTEEASVR